MSVNEREAVQDVDFRDEHGHLLGACSNCKGQGRPFCRTTEYPGDDIGTVDRVYIIGH